MSLVQLRRVDPARNMARFYVLDVAQDLFGGWWLIREHGRIGSPGRVIRTACASLDEAAARHARLWQEKVRRGYTSPAPSGPSREDSQDIQDRSTAGHAALHGGH